MTAITIKNLVKSYGAARAVDDVSLVIEPGELFFLLGPSGCGKTTLLRMLAGFVEPDSGDAYVGGQSLRGVPPRKRQMGMVFQNYALWPHRTVAGNVAYGLEVRGLSRAAIAAKVEDALKLVHLEGLGDRKPGQLSGGQQQRVALARALVIQPRVLLLDEPLSNLDARLRLEMREEIRRLHDKTGLTMVYVTHDQKEALSLASRIGVMHQGRLSQVGTPADLYLRPRSRFVAEFLGDANFVAGVVAEAAGERGVATTPLGPLRGIATQGSLATGTAVLCCLRPEALQAAATPGPNVFEAVVEHVAFLGETLSVELRAAGQRLVALGLQGQFRQWRSGQSIRLRADEDQVVILRAE